MASKSDRFPSRTLSANDLIVNGRPQLKRVTIVRVVEEQFTNDGKTDTKPVAYFKETEKGLVISATKWDAIAQVSGVDDDDQWVGTKLELFLDKVKFQGKLVNSIGVRPIGGWPQDAAEEVADTDLPF